MTEQKNTLAEHGMPVQDGLDIDVVEDANHRVHITRPSSPAEHDSLSDEELADAAGGADSDCKCHPARRPHTPRRPAGSPR